MTPVTPSSVNMPPLPKPSVFAFSDISEKFLRADHFTADQMREYARAALAERTQQEALTDEQIDKLCEGIYSSDFENRAEYDVAIARAIEAAHGIGSTRPTSAANNFGDFDKLAAEHPVSEADKQWAKDVLTSAANSTAPMQPSDLHRAIMNIRCDTEERTPLYALAYRLGHRDCRHAAAELALAAPTQAAPADAVEPRTTPLCRDCADFGPICPSSGQPCDKRAAAVPLSSMPDLQAAVAKGLADGSLVPQGAAAAPEGLTAIPVPFTPSDWVMSVAGVVVKLDEWEPGAMKARDYFKARRPATPDAKTAEARKPLAPEKLQEILDRHSWIKDDEFRFDHLGYGRAIEREHGIGDQP